MGKWIQKLQEERLVPAVLILRENVQDPCETEKELIAAYRLSRMADLNATDGGDGTSGWHHSEETKQKLRKPRSEEVKLKISQGNKGKKRTEAEKKNLSVKMKTKRRTEAEKKNLSEKLKGHPVSEETRRNLREAWKRRKTRAQSSSAS
ncbi:MAG: NUMOD3 domain-containing DNA-binding protein [Acidiferrobacterales bacterium]